MAATKKTRGGTRAQHAKAGRAGGLARARKSTGTTSTRSQSGGQQQAEMTPRQFEQRLNRFGTQMARAAETLTSGTPARTPRARRSTGGGGGGGQNAQG